MKAHLLALLCCLIASHAYAGPTKTGDAFCPRGSYFSTTRGTCAVPADVLNQPGILMQGKILKPVRIETRHMEQLSLKVVATPSIAVKAYDLTGATLTGQAFFDDIAGETVAVRLSRIELANGTSHACSGYVTGLAETRNIKGVVRTWPLKNGKVVPGCEIGQDNSLVKIVITEIIN